MSDTGLYFFFGKDKGYLSVSGDFRVAEYRAYTVGIDGHFTGFEPLVCADDTEATEQARRLVEGCNVELWCGERLVIRLTAKNGP
jgi:hypothetical protein